MFGRQWRTANWDAYFGVYKALTEWERAWFAGHPPPSVLAHYTSVQSAVSIITSQKVRLFNARTLNDDEEIEHALTLTSNVLKSESKALKSAVNESVRHLGNQQGSVFVFCASEQIAQRGKLPFDRLDMWRAYGDGGAGVALYLRPKALIESTVANLNAPILGKVQYSDSKKRQLIKSLMETFKAACATFKCTHEEGAFALSQAIWRIAPFLKHRAFEGEREWRVALEIATARPTAFDTTPPPDGRVLIQFDADGRPFVEVPLARVPGALADTGILSFLSGGAGSFAGAMVGPSKAQKVSVGILASALLKVDENASRLPIDLSVIPYRGRS